MASRGPQNQAVARPGGGHSPAHAWISSSVTVASGTRDRPRAPAVVRPCAPAPARGAPLSPQSGGGHPKDALVQNFQVTFDC